MSSNHSTTNYSFLDFQFSPSQHQLHHKNQPIQLSKKSHDLLLALVQSRGQVLKKDQLIDLIWPNQIVTDAALNKQITRLRQSLSKYDSTPIIETVRGVGIRFTTEPRIQIIEPIQAQQRRKTTWVIGAIVLVAALMVWMLKNKQPINNLEWDQISTVNMAIIPAISNDDWLNVGAIDYLSTQLLEYPTIQTIKPENDWFKKEDAEIFGIELSQTEGIEYVLMLENRNNNNSYSADLSLRNSKQIIAKKSLQAQSINLLLRQIETWTLEQLKIEAKLSDSQTKMPIETTEFVMENYLRGVAAAHSKQFSQAQRLLNTATDQDPKFYPAWFSLAHVESELGHFNKALGLINTIESSDIITPELTPKIQSIKAGILIYLNRLDEAKALMEQSNQTAEQNQDVNVIMKNLNNQLMLNYYNRSISEADIDTQEKLLNLTKKYTPSPNQIGIKQINLALVYFNNGYFDRGIKMSDAAINSFSASNNAEGLLSAYRIKSSNYAFHAKNGEALLVLEKAMPLLNLVEGARSLSDFWLVKARAHFAEGELVAANQAIDSLHQMSIKHASLQLKVQAWVTESELALTYNLYQKARTVNEKLITTILANPESYPNYGPVALLLDLYTEVLDGQIDVARTRRTDYLNIYPKITEVLPDFIKRIDAQILAADGYTKQAIKMLSLVEQSYLKQQDIYTANHVAREIIEINGTDDLAAIEMVINRVQNRPYFPYPFNKYQAQLMYQRGKLIPAITLLLELKSLAKDFWKPQDQLLLESWQQENSRTLN